MTEEAEDLLERLSEEGRRLAPVVYRLAHTAETRAASVMRLVESRPYRASGYVCFPFRKPISKCLEPDEP
jgi:hypothetical protein